MNVLLFITMMISHYSGVLFRKVSMPPCMRRGIMAMAASGEEERRVFITTCWPVIRAGFRDSVDRPQRLTRRKNWLISEIMLFTTGQITIPMAVNLVVTM